MIWTAAFEDLDQSKDETWKQLQGWEGLCDWFDGRGLEFDTLGDVRFANEFRTSSSINAGLMAIIPSIEVLLDSQTPFYGTPDSGASRDACRAARAWRAKFYKR
ncbi:hypothetical protein CLCR_09323 [Cladophialophora carrionii]|uniref:Uncharacterized protein n=1 Tax=Cladophialophora carrionii TaxID=86049 RepID=A0A1C1CUQ0_9EURO|nr:hypothetical protein CLCR_09323 [Cladophialophora carrionii]